MAVKVGHALASVGAVTDIDTAARNTVGTRCFDELGNEYIYLIGVASTVAGSCVTYNASYQTALSVTGAKGPVAWAMAATVASTWGWYFMGGKLTTAVFAGAAVNGAKLYSAGTGTVDDAVVSGDQITGAIVGATVSGAGAGTIFANAPFMNGLG